MESRYRCVILVVLVAAVLAGDRADSQTTAPAAPTATTAASPAPKIRQPEAFLELSAKAKKLKAVFVKGAAIAESDKDKDTPAELRRVEFEIWAQPPAAKLHVSTPVPETRLSDGSFVYAFRQEPPQGRQRRLTPANYYHALEVAAVICDAAKGYENLASRVKFVPISHRSKYDGKLPALTWFQLVAASDPPHHLLKDTEDVKVGFDPKDGLARVLVGRIERDNKETTLAVVFETVRHGPIKAGVFTLPADAAKAKWIDVDRREPIATPQKIIEPAP